MRFLNQKTIQSDHTLWYKLNHTLWYTGRTFEAQEAEKIGFVSKIVPDEKLLDSALEINKEMLYKSPLGLRMTKEAINLSLDSPRILIPPRMKFFEVLKKEVEFK